MYSPLGRSTGLGVAEDPDLLLPPQSLPPLLHAYLYVYEDLLTGCPSFPDGIEESAFTMCFPPPLRRP